jgi:hypothetical protein
MILVQLDKATRDELKALRRQELPPRVRDLVEMVLLSSVAWSPARIATHLGYCAPTIRSRLKDFLDRSQPTVRLSAQQLAEASARTGEASNEKVKRHRAEPHREFLPGHFSLLRSCTMLHLTTVNARI